MIKAKDEPMVSVGLMEGAASVRFEIDGQGLEASPAPGGSILLRQAGGSEPKIEARLRYDDRRFTIRDIVIGIDFHWERKQDQHFSGNLVIEPGEGGALTVINEVPVEQYLASVISSEMSPTAHPELLRAHAVISRSWLLAQMKPWKTPRRSGAGSIVDRSGDQTLIRWYDQESHTRFDVCADDHCQRYQGLERAATPAASAAIAETRGLALTYRGGLCDARFSKSCGGMTEDFAAAWDDQTVPYLTALYDGEIFPEGFDLPLSDDANAERWFLSSPPAFCNSTDPAVIRKILPDFDQETMDFYRWRLTIAQDELRSLLLRKLGIDFGRVKSLQPVERGRSGRIVRLKITGELQTLTIGKELEIRRALSKSHLYSSAFIVRAEQGSDGFPDAFHLTGAGWGHGVGLCQIGAALMAEKGYNYREILAHYYPGAALERVYGNSEERTKLTE